MFILAAKPYLEDKAAERMKAAGERGKEGGRGKKKTPEPKPAQGFAESAERTPQTRDQLAEQAGVSEHKVRQAEAGAKDAPESLGSRPT